MVDGVVASSVAAMPWSVKILGIILLSLSTISWALIITKCRTFFAARTQHESFEALFWSGKDLSIVYNNAVVKKSSRSPVKDIFCAGYKSLLGSKGGAVSRERCLEQCRSAMLIEQKKWELTVHSQLTWLATIASVSPYLGLLGTVFGVMHTFQGLLNANVQSSLSAVAPGISEALGMTALGLVVAIPATVAYNRLMLWLDDLLDRQKLFQDEFVLLLEKQMG